MLSCQKINTVECQACQHIYLYTYIACRYHAYRPSFEHLQDGLRETRYRSPDDAVRISTLEVVDLIVEEERHVGGHVRRRRGARTASNTAMIPVPVKFLHQQTNRSNLYNTTCQQTRSNWHQLVSRVLNTTVLCALAQLFALPNTILFYQK